MKLEIHVFQRFLIKNTPTLLVLPYVPVNYNLIWVANEFVISVGKVYSGLQGQ
jgi:hypothetical protein